MGQAPVLFAAISAHCRRSVIQADLLLLTVMRTRCCRASRGRRGAAQESGAAVEIRENMQGDMISVCVCMCVTVCDRGLISNGMQISDTLPIRPLKCLW